MIAARDYSKQCAPAPGTFSETGTTISPLLLTACLTVSLAQADPPRAEPAVPAGKWSVEIKKDGTATVTKPARSSDGKVTSTQGSFLFVCEDGRVERWTPVERRMVVEHWASADLFPNGTPVKGIAEVTD